ncbi:unnamed protein product [Prunus armeniaca]|uniref:Uncharacterized protein n=1 Tax=Prunus armeniaca TaxID=36596 RepID=A0A6J5WQL5_PRUAR|nr:unnamed protein product [Prunus armeniaca]CAB4304016.1 unnamed protein product [Prunus armeniaca]
MKHISLSPSTELDEIAISVTPFRTPSSPRLPSPSRRSIHRAHRVQSTELASFAKIYSLPLKTNQAQALILREKLQLQPRVDMQLAMIGNRRSIKKIEKGTEGRVLEGLAI